MLHDDDADALLERAIERALSRLEGWRELVRDLAGENPEATVADLAVAMARAGHAIEETFAGDEAEPEAGRDALRAHLYRLAALAWLDAWTMAGRGWRDPTVRDLGLYRRLHADTYLGDAFPDP